jgi:arginine/serine-rich splicing factor 4/5/6
LPFRERDLERLFEKFGRLVRVQIKRTYAFIQYEEVDQAEAAMKETHLSRFMGTPPKRRG